MNSHVFPPKENSSLLFLDDINKTVRYSVTRLQVLEVVSEFNKVKYLFLATDDDATYEKFHQIRIELLEVLKRRGKWEDLLSAAERAFKKHDVEKYLV